MKCPSCPTENPEEAEFCKKCGCPLRGELKCAKCQCANTIESDFCIRCGNQLLNNPARQIRLWLLIVIATLLLLSIIGSRFLRSIREGVETIVEPIGLMIIGAKKGRMDFLFGDST